MMFSENVLDLFSSLFKRCVYTRCEQFFYVYLSILIQHLLLIKFTIFYKNRNFFYERHNFLKKSTKKKDMWIYTQVIEIMDNKELTFHKIHNAL